MDQNGILDQQPGGLWAQITGAEGAAVGGKAVVGLAAWYRRESLWTLPKLFRGMMNIWNIWKILESVNLVLKELRQHRTEK